MPALPEMLSVAQCNDTIGGVKVAAAVLAIMSARTAPGAGAQPAVPTVDERVVVTGTAAPATIGAVGRTLAVVTAEDLARLPVASVTDALRSFSIRAVVATKYSDASTKLLDSIVREHKSKFINTDFIF